MSLDEKQGEIAEWVRKTFGETALDKRERMFRFFEEAIELFQSEGMTKEDATKMLDFVYAKKPGERTQEVGGVFCTLLAYCGTVGISALSALEDDLKYMQGRPQDQWRARLQRKIDAGVSVVKFEEDENG